MLDGHPSHYCLPTTVDSADEQQVYCEAWRAFRIGGARSSAFAAVTASGLLSRIWEYF